MGELINGKTPEEIKVALSRCVTGLRCQSGKHGDCPYYVDCLIGQTRLRPMKDALALIEHLEDERNEALEKVPRWISVEERLPDVQETVLFCHMIGKDVKSVRTGYRSAFTPGRFYTTNGMGTDTVTHWMPLPKKPDED